MTFDRSQDEAAPQPRGVSRRLLLLSAAVGIPVLALQQMQATSAVAAVPFSSPFDPRPNENWEQRGFTSSHGGIDIRIVSEPVYAAGDGVVFLAARDPNANGTADGGLMIGVDHGAVGLVTRYAHLSSFNVGVGDVVRQGQKIAVSGATGRVTGPHLHYEVATSRSAVNRVDPKPYTNFNVRPDPGSSPAPTPTPLEDIDMLIFMAGSAPGYGFLVVGGGVTKLNTEGEMNNLIRAGAKVVWVEQATLTGLIDDMRGRYDYVPNRA